MSAPEAAGKDAFVDLAERIFISLAARVYGTLAGTEQRKPDPKALATFSFKLAEAFEQATAETPRRQVEVEVYRKAAVKIGDVDLSGLLNMQKKP
jgi:hypothetical protein